MVKMLVYVLSQQVQVLESMGDLSQGCVIYKPCYYLKRVLSLFEFNKNFITNYKDEQIPIFYWRWSMWKDQVTSTRDHLSKEDVAAR